MSQGYVKIRNEYLSKAWARGPEKLARCLPAELDKDRLMFSAFGETCTLAKKDITLSGKSAEGPEGLLIAIYASQAPEQEVQLHPLKSFKDLPNSMPYHAAFAANAESILVPHVSAISLQQERLISIFAGHINTDAISGDFSLTLFPLPRVPLYYIFHLPDEEFPPSVTCLFASNANDFMPGDGLADVAEYTARKIISCVSV
jgi:hypothetical protein